MEMPIRVSQKMKEVKNVLKIWRMIKELLFT
jgi:hypothetical protein